MKVFPTLLYKDKTFFQSTDNGYITGGLWPAIMKHSRAEISDLEHCDVVFLFVLCFGPYDFDAETAAKLVSLKKPIVIIDYAEEWSDDCLSKSVIFGHKVNDARFLVVQAYGDPTTYYGDYSRLNDFLLKNKSLIKCYFKRELPSTLDLSDCPFRVVPIEYIADYYYSSDPPDTFEQYINRPILYNVVWGYSNASRYDFHGMVYSNYQKFHMRCASSFRQAMEFFKNEYYSKGEKFLLTINCEWYERIPLEELFDFQKKSMMVVDLYGNGCKCFRSTESTINSLSVKQDPSKVKYTYPWIDKQNCIVLPVDENNRIDTVKSLDVVLRYKDSYRRSLYDMYLWSIDTNRLYSLPNYVPNHIIRNVKETV